MLAIHSPVTLSTEDATVPQFPLKFPILLETGKCMIRRRLSKARIVTPATIPEDVLTNNNHITYRCCGDARFNRSSQGIVLLRSVIGSTVLGHARVIIERTNAKSAAMLHRRELQAIFEATASAPSSKSGTDCRSPLRSQAENRASGEAKR